MIFKAKQFAIDAHQSIGQRRKHGNKDPYETHPIRVAAMVFDIGGSDEMTAAAFLHDVLEDVAPNNPEFGLDRIISEFGNKVASLTLGLTDRFTHEAFPKANRAIRKVWEAGRLSLESDEVKIIKLADIIDNAASMPRDGFGKKWNAEAMNLVGHLAITEGPWAEAYLTLADRARKILTGVEE